MEYKIFETGKNVKDFILFFFFVKNPSKDITTHTKKYSVSFLRLFSYCEIFKKFKI